METLPGLYPMQIRQQIDGIANARKEMDDILKEYENWVAETKR